MSTLKSASMIRLPANPKLPPHEPWSSVTEASRVDCCGSPRSKNAFAGFCPSPTRNRWPKHDVSKCAGRTQDDGSVLTSQRRIGQGLRGVDGRRRSPLLCRETALQAIVQDDRTALDAALDDLEYFGALHERVSKSPVSAFGAPYAMGPAALWSIEYFDGLAGKMNDRVAAIAAMAKRHYSMREWAIIEERTFTLANYGSVDRRDPNFVEEAARGRIVLRRIVPGDSLLHIALRVHAVRTAGTLVARAANVAAANELGETPSQLLRPIYEAVLQKLMRIRDLKTQFNSHTAPDLDAHELAELKDEPQLVQQWEHFHDLCRAIRDRLEERMERAARLEHKQWRSKLEGSRLSPTEARELAMKARITEDHAVAYELTRQTMRNRRPGANDEIRVPPEVELQLKTLSRLIFETTHVDLGRWLADTERVTTKLQAMWRGRTTRIVFDWVMQDRAAVPIQAQWRRVMAVAHVSAMRRESMAVRLQCWYRRLRAIAEVNRLRRKVEEDSEARIKAREEAERKAEAERALRKSTPLLERLFPTPSLEKAQQLLASGKQLRGEGRTAQARRQFEKALRIQLRRLGKDNLDTAATANDLANMYRRQGRGDRAKKLYRQALQSKQRTLGDLNPSTALTKVNIGNIYEQRGDFVTAQDYYDEALPVLQKQLGMRHPTVAAAMRNSGITKEARGNLVEAVEMFKHAANVYATELGREHPTTLDCIQRYNKARTKLGNRR